MHAKILKFYFPSPVLPSCPFIYTNIYYTVYNDTQISLLCLYRQFIINNSEFMTRYNFNFYHSTRSGSKLFQKFYIRVIEWILYGENVYLYIST